MRNKQVNNINTKNYLHSSEPFPSKKNTVGTFRIKILPRKLKGVNKQQLGESQQEPWQWNENDCLNTQYRQIRNINSISSQESLKLTRFPFLQYAEFITVDVAFNRKRIFERIFVCKYYHLSERGADKVLQTDAKISLIISFRERFYEEMERKKMGENT